MRSRRKSRVDAGFGSPSVALAVVLVLLFGLGGCGTPANDRTASGPLPFHLPATAELRASPHLVFAHYFPPYPISLDNRTPARDYYAAEYLRPDGEEGRHEAYGGFLRDRPLPRPVSASRDWALEDMRTEVRRASDAGLDGFTVDLLGLEGSDHWATVELLLRAAEEVDPSFRIVLMPDATSPAVQDPQSLAASVARLSDEHPSLFRLADGRLVVSPFAPELVGAAWWAGWMDLMRGRYGITIALVPCFVDEDVDTWAPFVPFSHGLSDWGDRSPALNTDLTTPRKFAQTAGKLWMQPVSFQDQRPAQGVFDEANNTENLRLTWEAALEGADWVQLTTWNDYAEGSALAPSTHIGWGPLDISSYYLTRFKTGSWPTIVDDVVYLSHRVQFAEAVPTGQRRLMDLRSGSGPVRDDVEVLAFLPEAAVVVLDIGEERHTFSLTAGVHAVAARLAVGRVRVQVLRAGEVVTAVSSPFEVLGRPEVQDEGYHVVSSGRAGTDSPSA